MVKHYASILCFILLFSFALEDSLNSIAPARRNARLQDFLTDFDAFVHRTLNAWNMPGAAITVVRNDTVVFLRSYGVRERGKPDPIDEHTVFRTASVSKGFAAALSGLLVRENLLNWEDPVTDYCRDFRLADSSHTNGITVEHLLSHTTGLMPHAYDDLLEADVPYSRIIAGLPEVPIIGPPGECYGYQNVLFSLIGKILEKATGETFEELLRSRIFDPLGMCDASVGWDAYQASENRVRPHKRRYYRYAPTRDKKAYYAVLPAAGVNASISDMARWLRAMMGGFPDILPPSIIEEITTPRIITRRELRRFHWNGKLTDAHYGLGWRIFHYDGRVVIHHSGGIEGYMSEVSFLPEENIGIAVLFNAMPYDFLSPAFFDLYFTEIQS